MSFKDAILANFGDEEEQEATLRDIAAHGCSAGFPGLIYYTDTMALYDEHNDEIWGWLFEDAESLGRESVLELIAWLGGAELVTCDTTFKNLLVWYAAERVANEL